VLLKLARGTGLLAWHALDGPPRVVIELGERRPTPTPAPVRIVERTGPPPIVIDPGHGGDDMGAGSDSGLVEKQVTLAIARRVADLLQRRGYPVRLTRSGDEARALTDRTALANRLEARVFVSLHANASTAPSVRGAETYYMSLDRSASDAAAAATARTENRVAESNGSARSPIDMILWDLAQSDVLNQSASLALSVQQQLNAVLDLQDRGVKQAPFVVLTGATMPSVLVEVGFLSHPEESRLLATAAHQQRLAEAIARGIEDFLEGS
jgi:N-acetylmuramoyl-L-alanine amidase